MITPNYHYPHTFMPEIYVVNHVPALLAYWDKDLICRYANQAYQQWFGKTPEEMMNNLTIKAFLGPFYERNKPYIQAALTGEAQTFEIMIPLPSGKVRYALVNYTPHIVDGIVEGFAVHASDVSSIKALELELVNSIDSVKNQNNRLLNFSNIVSHNLKSYAGNLQAILDLYELADTEEEKTNMFGMLKSISKQFSNTIHQLNEISKSQNLAKLKPESIHLQSFTANVLNTLQVQIETNHATIENRIPDTIWLTANPVYIESILLNLITNAIKYRKPDLNPVVQLEATDDYNNIVLVVKDNGIGIDLAVHGKNLFGMYKTFHGNSDAQGIGLFLVKNQIESMGGNIAVTSAVNEGTVFTIHFKKAYTLL